MQTFVLQGLASISPACHFGIILSTRSTSRSHEGSSFCSSSRSDTLPSLLTMNCATTLPLTFRFEALAGYFRFFVSHFMNSEAPPGNWGRSSTTRKSMGSSYISTTSGLSASTVSLSFFSSGRSTGSGSKVSSMSSSTSRSSSVFTGSSCFACGSIIGISSLSRLSGDSSISASSSASSSKKAHPVSEVFHSSATNSTASTTSSPSRNA